MAAMEGQEQQAAVVVEKLNQAVQQQLNLESLKTRAISLFKAISRILEDFDAYSRTNTTPKWFLFIYLFLFLFLSLLSIHIHIHIHINRW